jgi:ABC-type Zn uptake system ZnuABC Zn-binding protein ZnuA
MSRWVILAAVLGAVLAGGCSTNKPAGSAEQRHGRILRVVATTTQVGDFARNLGGDRVQVTSLLKPNLDAHDFEPSPADVEAIARADLVVENGAGLESWLHDTITNSGFDGPLVDTSQGIRLRQLGGQVDPTSGRTRATPRSWWPPSTAPSPLPTRPTLVCSGPT